MELREKILFDFIKRFFCVAKTKRRHDKNSVRYLIKLINRIFDFYCQEKYEFTEDEILEAFYNNGFLILDAIDEGVLHAKTVKGKVVFFSNKHVNVSTKELSDLFSSTRKGFPEKSNPDTMVRISKVKTALEKFMKEHQLVNN